MTARNDERTAQTILAKYTEKQPTKIDELKNLHKAVRRPAIVFASILGTISAIVMGFGMSLVMTDIGTTLGIPHTMTVGIIIGVLGMLSAFITYIAGKKIYAKSKKKYAGRITALSNSIIEKSNG